MSVKSTHRIGKKSPEKLDWVGMEYSQRAADFNRAKVNFIMTDLDVAITFAKIARESTDQEKVIRNRQNARKGYDAVVHFLSTASLTPMGQKTIKEKLEWLKSALSSLGESF